MKIVLMGVNMGRFILGGFLNLIGILLIGFGIIVIIGIFATFIVSFAAPIPIIVPILSIIIGIAIFYAGLYLLRSSSK